jgi:hypothetical protein
MNRDKLKIAFLHRADDIYAIQRIKLLLKADHLIFSIILPGKDFNLLDDPKLRVICLKKAPLSFSVSKRIIYKNQIDKILNEIKPDVFHVVSALNLYYC